MDEFLYQIELIRINSITKQHLLLKEMSKLSSQCVNISGKIARLLVRSQAMQQVALRGLQHDDRIVQIATIYQYSLYIAARQRYFDLNLDISKLPNYVLWNVLYIDIEQTIKHLRTKP